MKPLNNKYSELDIPTLQACAHDWANEHPCIHDILLYRAGSERKSNGIKYVIVSHSSEMSQEKLPLDVDCSNIRDEIPDFYMNKTKVDPSAWMYFFLDFDENMEEYNEISDDFVQINTGFTLYDRNWHKKYDDLPLDENPATIVEKRNENIERVIWNTNIQPLIDLHYNGVFQYQFFPEPVMITQGDLDNMLRKTMVLCYRGYDPIFGHYQIRQTTGGHKEEAKDDFVKEVMKRLKASQTKFNSIDLKGLFYTFLDDLFQEETLPIFLELLNLDYPEGIWPQEMPEQGPDSQNSTKLNIKEQFNKKSPEEKLNKILSEVELEIETLYQGIKGEIKTRNKPMFEVKLEIALSVYESKRECFKVILQDDIKKSRDGFGTEKPYRDIKGRLLLNIIKRKMPDEFISKKIPRNHQEIYKCYLNFKKQPKK